MHKEKQLFPNLWIFFGGGFFFGAVFVILLLFLCKLEENNRFPPLTCHFFLLVQVMGCFPIFVALRVCLLVLLCVMKGGRDGGGVGDRGSLGLFLCLRLVYPFSPYVYLSVRLTPLPLPPSPPLSHTHTRTHARTHTTSRINT